MIGIEWARASQFNWTFDNMGGTPLQDMVAGLWSGVTFRTSGNRIIIPEAAGGGRVYYLRGVWKTDALFAWNGFWTDPEAGDTNYYPGSKTTLDSGWAEAKETWQDGVTVNLTSNYSSAITAGKYKTDRYEVPLSGLTGDKIRITFPAHATITCNVAGASIGPRSGATQDFTATPTRLTFNGGSNGFTSTAGGSVTSDPIAFAYEGSVPYLIHTAYGPGGTLSQKYVVMAGNDLHYSGVVNQDDVLTPAVTGYTYGANEIGDFNKIAVRTSVDSYSITRAVEPVSVHYNAVDLERDLGAGEDVALGKWDWSAGTLYVNVGEDPTTYDLDVIDSPAVGYFENVGNETIVYLGDTLADETEVQAYYVYNTGEKASKYDALNSTPCMRPAWRSATDYTYDFAVDRIFDAMAAVYFAYKEQGLDPTTILEFFWQTYMR